MDGYQPRSDLTDKTPRQDGVPEAEGSEILLEAREGSHSQIGIASEPELLTLPHILFIMPPSRGWAPKMTSSEENAWYFAKPWFQSLATTNRSYLPVGKDKKISQFLFKKMNVQTWQFQPL